MEITKATLLEIVEWVSDNDYKMKHLELDQKVDRFIGEKYILTYNDLVILSKAGIANGTHGEYINKSLWEFCRGINKSKPKQQLKTCLEVLGL